MTLQTAPINSCCGPQNIYRWVAPRISVSRRRW